MPTPTRRGVLGMTGVGAASLLIGSGPVVGSATAGDGREICVFSPKSGYPTCIGIDSSANPVQDAWDVAGDGATILYPPGDIPVPATLSGAGGTRHIGMGSSSAVGATRFVDTDETTPTYHATVANDEHGAYFTGIRFETAAANRSAPGFVFDARVRRWEIGPDIAFDEYSGGDLFHFDTGWAYNCTWRRPWARKYNSFLRADSLGPGPVLQAPYLQSDDASTPEINVNDVGALYLTHGWNKGGYACPIWDGIGGGHTVNAQHFVGQGRIEPGQDATVDYFFKHQFKAHVEQHAAVVGGNFTLEHEHIQIDNAAGGSFNIYAGGNTLGITTDVKAEGVIRYAGPSVNVNNRTGRTLSYPVTCLGDVVKKSSAGSGYDGGQVDRRL